MDLTKGKLRLILFILPKVLDLICNGLALQELPFFYNVYLSPISLQFWQHPQGVPSIPIRFVFSFFLLFLVAVVVVAVVVLEAFLDNLLLVFSFYSLRNGT